jgi:gliding motility-associated-like protein
MQLLKTLSILTTFFCVLNSHATIILVENTLDSGVGSLRAAVADASPSAGDTILINVKGTITLASPIEFDSFTALTIIGPYAKHNTITASGIWSGSMFHISNSENIRIRSLGFVGGNGNTRHVTIENCPNDIVFNRCLFENSVYTAGGNGGSVEVLNSTATFSQCSFMDNTAEVGGAINTASATNLTVLNCTFAGNSGTNNAGAMRIGGTTTATLLFNTFVFNEGASAPEVIRATGSTEVSFQNNAIGDNGTGRQLRLNGTVGTAGRNVFKQNYPTEPDNFPGAIAGDEESTGVTLGLRASMLTDGYGLKYYPITSSSSDLINPASPAGTVPEFDCRNAPRALKGNHAANAYPDAGACEYTHLRVTSDGGADTDPDSFLDILFNKVQKDAVHYIEFDIVSPSNILLADEGIVDGAVYIIDGFSQPGSAIPGPHAIGTPGVTPGIIIIDLENGGGHHHGIKFDDDAAGSILQGIGIQGFDRHGVEPNRSDDISIFGCEIGISDGGTEYGNEHAGIRINSENNQIGGWEHWMRNVVSGNGLGGGDEANIHISFGNNGNVIQGNIIGGSADGMGVIGGATHTPYGIYNASRFNLIGGTLPNEGNIIIDNEYGSFHYRTGDFTTYHGNLIGLAYDESTALGNTNAGICFHGADDNLVGGYSNETANKIAHNGTGVEFSYESTIAEQNTILGNSIFLNDNQGIDINGDGIVLANDGIFSGANSNQGIDFPEITESTACDPMSSVTTFNLRVPPSEDYRVEFFTVTSPDATNGEGEFFVDATTISVTSNPQTIVYDHGFDLGSGANLTATVTQLSTGNTSEFGNYVTVAAPLGDPSISYDDICPGQIASPIYGGDTGGDFRFSDPVPVDGATIDAVSGEVTGGVEGSSYEVIYSFTGTCTVEDTATFTVSIIDETFTFVDFCPGSDGMPTGIATPGGAFSLSPDFGDGASITADGGILTGGIEGTTYTVQYIADDGTCQDTAWVDALVTPTDESFTMEDFCPEVVSSDAVPITLGGTFYFAPDPGDGATINAATGAVTGGVEGATYMIRYVVGSCAEEDTISVNVISIDESFVFDHFCPETVGSPSFVAEAGGFSFLTPPGDGAVINPGTGDITDGTEGTTYSVLHTVGVCNDKDTLYPMMIEVLEDFTFADFCIEGDSSSTLPIAVDPANADYSLFGAVDGETIDAATGRIYDPVEGTTYTVVNTNTTIFETIECTQTDTFYVTALLVNEDFEYDDICIGTSGFPYDVELGGSFSIVDDPGDGVTINALTGELSGGLSGVTYEIEYIKDDIVPCADTAYRFVTFVAADASFDFPDFCPGLNPSPSPEADFGPGTFGFITTPLDGATIDATDGFIIDPVEGNTYEIYYAYTDPSTTCSDTTYESVNVKIVNEEISYENFCWESSSSEPELMDLDGTLSWGTPAPVDGAMLSPEGIITEATESSVYTVVHTLMVDGCTQIDSALVTALGVDESFIFEDYCASEFSPAPVASTAGGTYIFAEDPLDGATIDPGTGVISNGIEGSYYIVMHSISDTTDMCNESDIDTVYVLGNDESFAIDNFCAEFPSDEPTPIVEGGTYTFEPDLGDGAEIDPVTGIITSAVHGETYGVKYTLVIDGCTDIDTNTVIAYASEDGSFLVDSYCANIETSIVVTGTSGGEFTFDPDPAPDGATIDASSGVITGSQGGTYDITYITPGSATTCEDTVTNSITLYDVPNIIDISSDKDIYCPVDELGPITITESFATSQIYWYVGDTGGTISDSSFTYTPASLQLGDNVFYAKPKSDQGCYGEYASYILFLSDTAGMGAAADFQICRGSAAQLLAFGGSSYQWHTDIPLADYFSESPTAFSLNEETYVVSIFNDDGCEVKDSTKVTFSPRNECAIDIYNAFSPNGDNKNDFWYIDNLINYVPNTVHIYTRWGDEVQLITDYDNITQYWDGTDKNGKDLPPNTYFYVVITEGADQSQAGWVQLVR